MGQESEVRDGMSVVERVMIWATEERVRQLTRIKSLDPIHKTKVVGWNPVVSSPSHRVEVPEGGDINSQHLWHKRAVCGSLVILYH